MDSPHRINPLNPEQLKSLDNVSSKIYKPVRFVCRGKSVNICTGILEGGNIIYQMVYWDRPPLWVNKVLAFLRQNNPNEKIRITSH